MLRKSGLENRFLIAARKKSAHLSIRDVSRTIGRNARGDCQLFVIRALAIELIPGDKDTFPGKVAATNF
jgi:hypothetical protein